MKYKAGLVAVIIANYNGQKVLGECIESLQKSTYKNYCIIVVDDCSTDSSVTFLNKTYTDVKVIQCRKNSGFAATNNIGIMLAINGYHAEYCLLLNNDTVVAPEMLGLLVNESGGERVTAPKMYFAYPPNRIWYDGGKLDFEKGCGVHFRFGTVDIKNEQKCSQKVTAAPFCCVLLPSEVVRKVGLLHTQYFMYLEDSDYCARLLENHIEIIYCPGAVLWHKVSYSMGNAKNPLILYYFTRNRLFFTRRHIKHGRWKVYSRIVKDMWEESLEQQGWKNQWYVIQGILDFMMKNLGRHNGI